MHQHQSELKLLMQTSTPHYGTEQDLGIGTLLRITGPVWFHGRWAHNTALESFTLGCRLQVSGRLIRSLLKHDSILWTRTLIAQL